MSEALSALGFVRVGRHEIKDGSKFDYLFPVPDFKNSTLTKDAGIDKTIEHVAEYIIKYQKDTAKLAPLLKGATVEDTCRNIWNFVYDYIQYKIDKPGEEQLRRPSRSWFERKTGVDCDCYSIFISTVLINLGIVPALRITKYDGKPNFQHIYPIVPLTNGKTIVLDCVVSEFNYEKEFSQKRDYTMNGLGIPVVGLHGVSGSMIGNVLNGIDPSNLEEIYQHLIDTREEVKKNPAAINTVDYAPGFLQMLDYAIANFYKSPAARDKAFAILAQNEAALNIREGVTREDIDGLTGNDDYLLGFDAVDNHESIDDDDVYPFDGLGRAKKSKADKKIEKQQKKENRQRTKAEKKVERTENKQERKTERKEAKGFFRKVGVAVKQGGKAFVKLNPAVIAARNGFLLALRLNLFGMSSRLKWAYATPESARLAGCSAKKLAASRDALAKVEQLFAEKLQGSKASMKQAILWNKNDTFKGVGDLMCVGGLGLIEEATVAAAAPIIAIVVATIAKSFRDTGADEEEIAEDGGDIMDEVDDAMAEDEDMSGFGFLKAKKNKTAVMSTSGEWVDRKAKRKAKKDTKKKSKEDKDAQSKTITDKVQKVLKSGKKFIDKKTAASPEAAKFDVPTEEEMFDDINLDNKTADKKKPEDNNSNDRTMLQQIGDFAKANPVVTIFGLGAAAYAFVPPVRDAVNNILGIKKKAPEAPAQPQTIIAPVQQVPEPPRQLSGHGRKRKKHVDKVHIK